MNRQTEIRQTKYTKLPILWFCKNEYKLLTFIYIGTTYVKDKKSNIL